MLGTSKLRVIAGSRSNADPIPATRSYRDPAANYRVVVARPADEPELWQQFMAGAIASYTRFGVAAALNLEKVADGERTSLFFLAQSEAGDALGGVRLEGPTSDPRQTNADGEFAADAFGRAALRRMITERIAHGVLEGKTGWVAERLPSGKKVADVVSQALPIAGAVLGARYMLCTSSTHAAALHRRAGAVVAEHIPAVTYPDDRYRTKVFWWDRQTLREHADPDAYESMMAATEAVLHGTGPFAEGRA